VRYVRPNAFSQKPHQRLASDRIESLCQELNFDRYFATSAKEGWGIEELLETIRTSINWDALPTVSSTELFQNIKTFLVIE
jgi:hypothetical protein